MAYNRVNGKIYKFLNLLLLASFCWKTNKFLSHNETSFGKFLFLILSLAFVNDNDFGFYLLDTTIALSKTFIYISLLLISF